VSTLALHRLPTEINLAVREAGHGPAVVLLHGYPLDGEMWEAELEALAARGLRAIAPDLRGAGGSDVGMMQGPVTMSRMADDIVALLDRLRIDRAAVVGLSMGGYVAFEILARSPDRVRGLVLSGTRATPDSEAGRASRETTAQSIEKGGIEAVVQAFLPKVIDPATQPALFARAAEMARRATPRGAAALLRGIALRADHQMTCARIAVPTLVLCGSLDMATPPDEVRALAQSIPGARYLEIRGHGHALNLEAPEAFQDAAVPFLERLPS
jgi:pimeloyl-ACP methyl ester carboxylesterase